MKKTRVKWARIDWRKWDALLGTVADQDLADRIGCDCSTVGLRRNSLDIPIYSVSRPENELIECACGCGKELWKYDERGRERQFLPSHWSRIQPSTRALVYCENCGAVLERPQWHLKRINNNFCNFSCFGEWLVKTGFSRGENNGMWAGGIGTFYPPEFNEQLREMIRERDGHICWMCGIGEFNLSRKLDIHHIDYDRNNNNSSNLIALCHSCHAMTSAPLGREKWIGIFEGVMC